MLVAQSQATRERPKPHPQLPARWLCLRYAERFPKEQRGKCIVKSKHLRSNMIPPRQWRDCERHLRDQTEKTRRRELLPPRISEDCGNEGPNRVHAQMIHRRQYPTPKSLLAQHHGMRAIGTRFAPTARGREPREIQRLHRAVVQISRARM